MIVVALHQHFVDYTLFGTTLLKDFSTLNIVQSKMGGKFLPEHKRSHECRNDSAQGLKLLGMILNCWKKVLTHSTALLTSTIKGPRQGMERSSSLPGLLSSCTCISKTNFLNMTISKSYNLLMLDV